MVQIIMSVDTSRKADYFIINGDEFNPILPAGIHCMTLEDFKVKWGPVG
jgi:hypothetical protein